MRNYRNNFRSSTHIPTRQTYSYRLQPMKTYKTTSNTPSRYPNTHTPRPPQCAVPHQPQEPVEFLTAMCCGGRDSVKDT